MSTTVGIVGCGLLGSAIARTLAASQDHEVQAWNRSPEAAEALVPDGVTAASTLGALVAAVDLVLVTVTTYDAAETVLEPVRDFEGTTVVVVSTGLPADAERMSAFITGRGGTYLDAALLGYPADLGKGSTVLVFSGPTELWENHAATFRTLGGNADHAAENVAAANVLDVAATGAFYTVAYGAMVEAATYARARNLDPAALIPAAEAWVAILRRDIEEVAQAVRSGEYESDQATVDVYLEAATAWREELVAAGMRGLLMAAEEENLAAASKGGYGTLGFPAQSLTMLRSGTNSARQP